MPDGWTRKSHEMTRDERGVFSISLPDDADGSPAIAHGSKIKVGFVGANGEFIERVPAWATRVIQDTSTMLYDGTLSAMAT